MQTSLGTVCAYWTAMFRLTCVLAVISTMFGCSSEPSEAPNDSGPLADMGADMGGDTITPRRFGVRADGRVDVSAKEAWPDRASEPVPLSREDVARAGVLRAACVTSAADSLTRRGEIAASFADATSWEERVVPNLNEKLKFIQERWSYTLRAILASGGDCTKIEAAETNLTLPLYCQESGCSLAAVTATSVTCVGEVATVRLAKADPNTYVRDCAKSYTRCAMDSSTGCSDRHITLCDSKASDRCDGQIKLGCDKAGNVSYHDCGIVGANCVEKPDGSAACVPTGVAAKDIGCVPSTCVGSKLTICAAGAMTTIDCKDLGYIGCTDGFCTK